MIIEDKLVRYVLFKKRTENEVRNKCTQLKYDEEYTDEVIEYLKEAGYLNDKVYVEKYINNVKKLKHASANEIRIDLMRKGVDSDLIDYGLSDDSINEFELESAIYLVNKKIKSGEDIEKVRKYLLNKGYTYSNVSKAIDNFENIDDN